MKILCLTIVCISKKLISKDLEKPSVAPYKHKCKVQYDIFFLIWKKKAYISQANSSATCFSILIEFCFIKKRLIARRLNDEFDYVHSIPPGTMGSFCQSLSLLQLFLWRIAGNRCNAIQQALKPSQAELHFQPFQNLTCFPILSLLPKFPLVGSWFVTGKLLRCN